MISYVNFDEIVNAKDNIENFVFCNLVEINLAALLVRPMILQFIIIITVPMIFVKSKLSIYYCTMCWYKGLQSSIYDVGFGKNMHFMENRRIQSE